MLLGAGAESEGARRDEDTQQRCVVSRAWSLTVDLAPIRGRTGRALRETLYRGHIETRLASRESPHRPRGGRRVPERGLRGLASHTPTEPLPIRQRLHASCDARSARHVVRGGCVGGEAGRRPARLGAALPLRPVASQARPAALRRAIELRERVQRGALWEARVSGCQQSQSRGGVVALSGRGGRPVAAATTPHLLAEPLLKVLAHDAQRLGHDVRRAQPKTTSVARERLVVRRAAPLRAAHERLVGRGRADAPAAGRSLRGVAPGRARLSTRPRGRSPSHPLPAPWPASPPARWGVTPGRE